MSDYKKSGDDDVPNTIPCPICNKDFDKSAIQEHANKCLFLNTSEQSKFQQKAVHPELFNNAKRSSSHLKNTSSVEKRTRLSTSPSSTKAKVSSVPYRILLLPYVFFFSDVLDWLFDTSSI